MASRVMDKEQILSIFRKWDLNNNGFIEKDELRQLLQGVGLPLEMIDPIFVHADTNKDGKIDYEELVKWICLDDKNAATMRCVAKQPMYPAGMSVLLAPDRVQPDSVKLNSPVPCKADDVAYWAAGGPGKGRIMVLEDAGVMKLAPDYTVAVRFLVGKGASAKYDTLLLGHDAKHWLAVECGPQRRLCCADSRTGSTTTLDYAVPTDTWNVVFLQPKGDKTLVWTLDDDGLMEAGTFDLSLVGSKLDEMGDKQADSETQIAEVLLWNRGLAWSEMAAAALREPRKAPAPPPKPEKAKPSFRGQVVDLNGDGVADVRVTWGLADMCKTDEDGCFAGELDDDAETDVPEGASLPSTSSGSTVVSFSCEGFAPMTSMPQCTSGGPEANLRVTLRPLSASSVVDAAVGGSVVDTATGSSVTVPPNTLVYPDGSPVEGPVTVSLSVIDANDPKALASMPGDFSAVGEDGSTVYLQSLGAAWVGATDKDGRELAVKEGSEGVNLDLKSKATADPDKLGTDAEMWSFNEASGKWELESTHLKVNGQTAPNAAAKAAPPSAGGSAGAVPNTTGSSGSKKIGRFKGKRKAKGKWDEESLAGPYLIEGCMSPDDFKKAVKASGEKSLSTNISKLGCINCDLAYHHPQRAVMMQGLVVGSGGEPLQGIQLWSVGKDYNGRCADVADKEGKFTSMIAQFDSQVDIEVQVQVPVKSDHVINIFIESIYSFLGKLPKEYQELIGGSQGRHSEKEAEKQNIKSDAGAPAWCKASSKDVPTSKVVWSAARRQWQHIVNGAVLFIKDDDPEAFSGPFGEGWRLTSSFSCTNSDMVYTPNYVRPVNTEAQVFGPFSTGPPGEFVDVGTIVARAC